MHSETDILIIGGGIAGCIAALALAPTFRVTLLDKQAAPTPKAGESLAPAARRIFRELGLMENNPDHETEQLYRPSLGMQSYWGSKQLAVADNLRNPDGFGYTLNRQAFEQYLRDTVIHRGVHSIWPARWQSSTYQANEWHITAKSDNRDQRQSYTLRAQLVIDATGRGAHFARSQGVTRQAEDHLIACWGLVPNSIPSTLSSIAAHESGWWYSAVLPSEQRLISFHTDADLIDRAAFRAKEAFLNLAESDAVIGKLLPKDSTSMDYQGIVSANSSRLAQVKGLRWLAIGDAAISFDPLSSQGMYHAMASAMQIRDLLLQHGGQRALAEQTLNVVLDRYEDQIDQIWQRYLTHKNLYYQQENRWANAPFWQRRHQQETAV
ncbi:MAG: tryptophan 7-halogenase [Bacteroidota bacterium]